MQGAGMALQNSELWLLVVSFERTTEKLSVIREELKEKAAQLTERKAEMTDDEKDALAVARLLLWEPDGKGYGPSDMHVVAEQLRHYLLALGYPKDDLTKALVRRYRPMFQTWSHPIGKS